MQRILVLASGNGTNAENLIRYFQNSPLARVALVLTDKPGAPVLSRARNLGIPTLSVPRPQLSTHSTIETLQAQGPFQLTVLAGFLGLLPQNIIELQQQRVINLHPALLPKFGGKGMYGNHVHRAVLRAGETLSGITIHWVNTLYDRGQPIFQASCRVLPSDTPDTLAARIHSLEHYYLPRVCEAILSQNINNPLGIKALLPPCK